MRKSLFIICIVTLMLAAITSCKVEFVCSPGPVAGSPATITDIDGNVYQTVQIGTQCWLKENLKTTHYRNGSPIIQIQDSSSWANILNDSLTTPAWCYYNFNQATNAVYGKLYNWYAVTDPNQLCPTGWHVPTDSEWMQLSTNSYSIYCDTLYLGPSGFALSQSSPYNNIDYFWTSTPDSGTAYQQSFGQTSDSSKAIFFQLNYGITLLPYGPVYKATGYPVRCVAN